MAWVRPIAQCVQNPHVDISQGCNALRRQIAEVARIRRPAEAKSEGRGIAVDLQDRQTGDRASGAFDRDRLAGGETVLANDRRIVAARRRFEAIVEPRTDYL